jgi:uncharacterized SAM-binding protein YcdF (DUF218 family)
MFFIISKILVVFFRPLFWIAVLTLWALLTKNARRKKVLGIVTLCLAFLCSNKVLVNELAILWEPDKNVQENYPKTAVVLGGFANMDTYRNEVAMTEAAERIYRAMALFRSGKIDTIIVSGGAASITGKLKPESIYVRQYLLQQGFDSGRIFIDTSSKNTFENARETAKILQKLGNRKVLLITSAFHIPRSVKCFQKAGVQVLPHSVQFISNPKRGYIFSDYVVPSSEALFHFDALIKEWVGYAVYRISGKA